MAHKKATSGSFFDRWLKTRFTFAVDKPEEKSRYNWKDWIAVAVITVIATILAFTNLGDRVAPQTFWTPERGEVAIIEFYDTAQITSTMLYHGAVSNQHIEFAVSIDGEIWETITFWAHAWRPTVIDTDEYGNDIFGSDEWQWGDDPFFRAGDVFAWLSPPINREARYVRMTAISDQVRIGQVGFRSEIREEIRDEYGELISSEVISNDLIPIRSVTSDYDNSNAKFLIDKQDTIPERRTFMNSTYFDEIFHPRSAYEMLNGMPVFESTHPQLGKLIMAFFINIFGMTPFGWRFAGALFGVLMVPLLFFFARDMFKSTFWATFGAALFAFDFMRFTQTRLATIDTYVVFFGLAAFYCMYKYYKMSFYHTPFWKTLMPLLASGIFMGLGIANKMQGVYVGIGLAVIFIIIMLKRFMEHSSYRRVAPYNNFNKLALKTCLWCLLFFVLIPIVIYSLHFIPYHIAGSSIRGAIRTNPGHTQSLFGLPSFLWWLPNNTVGNFFLDIFYSLGYQFWYHGVHVAGLDAHPFSSSWYQWIFNLRPMHYYIRYYNGLRSSIAAFGNPIIWWGGFAAIVAGGVQFILKHNKNLMFILIAYLALLIPFVGVDRMMFIYHYFPTVPFLILATVYVFKSISETQWFGNHTMVITKGSAVVYAGIAIALFALFYPVLAGVPRALEFFENLRWFSSWNF